ncbi:hypothetical protein EGW08_015986, partial [Elysia chlorotica]
NSVLSEGYLTGKGLESSKDENPKTHPTKTVKQNPDITKENRSNKVKPEVRDPDTSESFNIKVDIKRRQKSPHGAKDPEGTLDHGYKPSEPNRSMRQLRWSTSALGDAPKQPAPDNSHGKEVSRKIGPKFKNLCVRSEFTFSTYDFYNKHNSEGWWSSTIHTRTKSPQGRDLVDEETKIEELKNYKKIFSHGGIEQLVKGWAQETYRARALHMLLSGGAREEEGEEDEPVAPLLAHLKKQQQAPPDSLPSIFTSMRRNSVPPKPMRKSSVFYALPSFEHLPEQERIRKRKIRNFRWYSHMIRAMVRLSANMRQLSRDLTHKSAYSEFLYILAG